MRKITANVQFIICTACTAGNFYSYTYSITAFKPTLANILSVAFVFRFMYV